MRRASASPDLPEDLQLPHHCAAQEAWTLTLVLSLARLNLHKSLSGLQTPSLSHTCNPQVLSQPPPNPSVAHIAHIAHPLTSASKNWTQSDRPAASQHMARRCAECCIALHFACIRLQYMMFHSAYTKHHVAMCHCCALNNAWCHCDAYCITLHCSVTLLCVTSDCRVCAWLQRILF